MNDFIEMRILNAVRELLTGRVNELLGTIQYVVPIVEFGNYAGGSVVVPAIALNSCEQSEKERIINFDAYSLTITINLPDTPDSDLHCYVYAWAVCKALEENPTLGGVADKAVICGKKYLQPKKLNCGQGCEIILTLRITVAGNTYVC